MNNFFAFQHCLALANWLQFSGTTLTNSLTQSNSLQPKLCQLKKKWYFYFYLSNSYASSLVQNAGREEGCYLLGSLKPKLWRGLLCLAFSNNLVWIKICSWCVAKNLEREFGMGMQMNLTKGLTGQGRPVYSLSDSGKVLTHLRLVKRKVGGFPKNHSLLKWQSK